MDRVTKNRPLEAFDRDRGDRRTIKSVSVGAATLLFLLALLGWLG